jgi:hypothetical protein
VLPGTVGAETSNGQKRRRSSGDFFLADDRGTRGDRTRTIGSPARVPFVHRPSEAPIGD